MSWRYNSPIDYGFILYLVYHDEASAYFMPMAEGSWCHLVLDLVYLPKTKNKIHQNYKVLPHMRKPTCKSMRKI